jgi:hypothetical protein
MSDTDAGTRCHRRGCGHKLTASAGAGYGPVCEAKVREAAEAVAATYSPAQIDRALRLVASGRMIPVGAHGTWFVPSSDGFRDYLATASTCNCRAGSHGVPCYHRAAVALADA